jgi:hypothetical protein
MRNYAIRIERINGKFTASDQLVQASRKLLAAHGICPDCGHPMDVDPGVRGLGPAAREHGPPDGPGRDVRELRSLYGIVDGAIPVEEPRQDGTEESKLARRRSEPGIRWRASTTAV